MRDEKTLNDQFIRDLEELFYYDEPIFLALKPTVPGNKPFFCNGNFKGIINNRFALCNRGILYLYDFEDILKVEPYDEQKRRKL